MKVEATVIWGNCVLDYNNKTKITDIKIDWPDGTRDYLGTIEGDAFETANEKLQRRINQDKSKHRKTPDQ